MLPDCGDLVLASLDALQAEFARPVLRKAEALTWHAHWPKEKGDGGHQDGAIRDHQGSESAAGGLFDPCLLA